MFAVFCGGHTLRSCKRRPVVMASISELDADVLAPSPPNITGDAATAATATGDAATATGVAATAATSASGGGRDGATATTIPRTMTKSLPANDRFR